LNFLKKVLTLFKYGDIFLMPFIKSKRTSVTAQNGLVVHWILVVPLKNIILKMYFAGKNPEGFFVSRSKSIDRETIFIYCLKPRINILRTSGPESSLAI
jgi:hypothetical protein